MRKTPRNPAPNPNRWVYVDPRWKPLRQQALIRDGNQCRDPNHKQGVALSDVLDVDHIKEIEDGGAPFTLSNLLTRCRSCHKIKTKKAKDARFMKANRWRM